MQVVTGFNNQAMLPGKSITHTATSPPSVAAIQRPEELPMSPSATSQEDARKGTFNGPINPLLGGKQSHQALASYGEHAGGLQLHAATSSRSSPKLNPKTVYMPPEYVPISPRVDIASDSIRTAMVPR